MLVTGNQPGIADQTTASSGLGYNTTAGGDKHLQVLPLNNGPDGGVVLGFTRPAKALGFYLIGLEETKREVWAFIEFADGSNQAVLTDVGLNPGGGIQFFGFIAEDCPIKRFSLIELYDGEPAGDRDIFGVDDIRYVVEDVIPEGGGFHDEGKPEFPDSRFEKNPARNPQTGPSPSGGQERQEEFDPALEHPRHSSPDGSGTGRLDSDFDRPWEKPEMPQSPAPQAEGRNGIAPAEQGLREEGPTGGFAPEFHEPRAPKSVEGQPRFESEEGSKRGKDEPKRFRPQKGDRVDHGEPEAFGGARGRQPQFAGVH